jgi:hypothetical protein
VRLSSGTVIAGMALLCCGCDRYVHVTKEMSWECVPAERDPRYPEAEPVVFRYPEAPGFYDLASGRGLCEQLRASGRSTVKVAYEAWGSLFQPLHGYRIESVEGRPLRDIGGPARSGYSGQGHSDPHPLTKALRFTAP